MNKKTLALVIGGLVALPMAAAANTLENQTVVTGHTVYANMGGFDPDVAAIAGLAESKVVWFNGQTILSTLSNGYIYAVEAGSCDPLRGSNFTFQDYTLSFRDPNNETHVVGHYTYECALNPFDIANDPFAGLGLSANHLWVTNTHARLRDNPLTIGDAGRWYNFALAVNTDLFGARSDDGVTHSGEGGRTTDEINRGDSYCATEGGGFGDHVCNGGTIEGEDTEHTHNVAEVDLYFHREDRGIGAGVANSNSTHPGTLAGCPADPYCASVTDPNATYQDPTAAP